MLIAIFGLLLVIELLTHSKRSPSKLGNGVAAALFAGCASVRQTAEQTETRFWLQNMVMQHDYSDAEVARVVGVTPTAVPALLAEFGVERLDLDDANHTEHTIHRSGDARAAIQILPYPGGRHPRIGFLEGAVDPHRGTKVSVFTPWERASYVVVDLPEALWWKTGKNRELLYLAHTHIPTHWDRRGVQLPRIDWTRHADGTLEFRRRLPNGVQFGARITADTDRVEMELFMQNDSRESIAGLATQVCVLLKGARGFAAQTDDNKITIGETVAVQSDDGRRFIVTRWDGGATWNNPLSLHALQPTIPGPRTRPACDGAGRIVLLPGL